MLEPDEVARLRGRRPSGENVVSLAEAGAADGEKLEREQVEGAA